MAAKYIFVTGGVTSSLGKGITAASLGRLLKGRGLRVAMQKFDPYINVNPGMMSPLQHGEVFVTDDGGECDLDLGHYERFIDENLSVDSDVTSGQIYLSVINKERNGDYSGGTVQVIPHITNEIKKSVYRVARKSAADVVIIEIGGTVGDIESQPFLEAVRQIKWEVGKNDCMYIHVALVPYLAASGELKTKPTQHSVKILRSIGIQPDMLVCRCEHPLTKALRDKIGLFCNVSGNYVIPNYDASSIYEVPLMLQEEGLDELVCEKLHIAAKDSNMDSWRNMVMRYKSLNQKIKIGLVGKYVDLHDAYLSVIEALTHAGLSLGSEIDIQWISTDTLHTEEDVENALIDMDGVIVPAGFGERGMPSMIMVADYAREKQLPFFGIGLGMQMAVVAFARSICNLNAHSTEEDPSTDYPVIDLMSDYKDLDLNKANSMRLGSEPCLLLPGTIAHKAYHADAINERHRHRYELNPLYVPQLQEAGMLMAGINPGLQLVEIIELNQDEHPWYLGTQFQPEFTSRPNKPHPLFLSFLEACQKSRDGM